LYFWLELAQIVRNGIELTPVLSYIYAIQATKTATSYS
jgi:hypothetical protein